MKDREECWQLLKAQYPVLFDKYNVVPLAVGVTKEISKSLPEGFHKNTLKRIVRIWTGRKEYQNTLILGAPRYGTDGRISGEVTQEQLDKGTQNNVESESNEKDPHRVGLSRNR